MARSLDSGVLSAGSRSPNFQALEDSARKADEVLRGKSLAYNLTRTAGDVSEKIGTWSGRVSNLRKVLDEKTRTESVLELSKDALEELLTTLLPGVSYHPAFQMMKIYLDVTIKIVVAMDRAERFEADFRALIKQYETALTELDELHRNVVKKYSLNGKLHRDLEAGLSISIPMRLLALPPGSANSEKKRWIEHNLRSWWIYYGRWKDHCRYIQNHVERLVRADLEYRLAASLAIALGKRRRRIFANTMNPTKHGKAMRPNAMKVIAMGQHMFDEAEFDVYFQDRCDRFERNSAEIAALVRRWMADLDRHEVPLSM